nr:ATP synthase F0 subunit 8 [Aporrectodea tuberculata]UWM94595.1 ATP synthase F0 subunit 8 [Aporrectodea tuberculata]
MPHLSPMAWIVSIMMFWTSVSLMASTFWWSEHHTFNSKTSYSASSLENSWKWT